MSVGQENGEIINVWFVQDGLNFGPNPQIINASQTIPAAEFDRGLGAYTVNITWVPDPGTGTLSYPQTFTIQVGGASAGLAPFAISSGITGNWFDPDENGHGFGIEVLPDGEMLAEWYVYGPSGGRDWLVATGPITGNTAVLQAIQGTGAGAKFPPNFDETQVQTPTWGTLTLSFTDCNNGTASWQPSVAGYLPGTVPITRLTMPLGIVCP